MDSIEAIRHQVAIAGQVTDALTGKSLDGARLGITAAPAAFTDFLKLRQIQFGESWERMAERPDRTNSIADGSFRLLDLPDGQYKLTASLPGAGSRYGAADATVTVARDGQGKIKRGVAQIALPPTTIKGRITGQGASALHLAEVRVKGSGERAFSDAQGQYLLAGVEAGVRTVFVSAQGFQPATQTVTLNQPGAAQTLDVALTRSP
jgi:Carboxypeptidase regulatory-like domain